MQRINVFRDGKEKKFWKSDAKKPKLGWTAPLFFSHCSVKIYINKLNNVYNYLESPNREKDGKTGLGTAKGRVIVFVFAVTDSIWTKVGGSF